MKFKQKIVFRSEIPKTEYFDILEVTEPKSIIEFQFEGEGLNVTDQFTIWKSFMSAMGYLMEEYEIIRERDQPEYKFIDEDND